MLKKISLVMLWGIVLAFPVWAESVVQTGFLEKIDPHVRRVVVDGNEYALADAVYIQNSGDTNSFLSLWDLRPGYKVMLELYPDARGEMRIEKMTVFITQQ